MNIRKIFGKSSREALLEVKRILGPDAAVLSNRSVEGGVEIMAMAAEDIPAAEQRHAPPAAYVTVEDARTPTAAAPVLADSMVQTIISEIAAMRSDIEQQLDGLAWGEAQRRDPARMTLLRTLLQVGFSPALSRKIMDRLPTGLDANENNAWVKAAITRNLPAEPADAMIAQGGVYALMGPTGVGKTTTTAKLAARCVVRHGAESLALLTTDSYRIGGQEQLRIYGRILGVSVHAVHDAADFKRALDELKNKHLVLIDTVGVGQRDQMVAEQVKLLCSGNARRLLLLNATCSGQTLDDVIQAYQGNGLHGCIVTKLDEAANVAPVIDAVIRHKLSLHYVANGQRVPEDLHVANREVLVHRAFKPVTEASAHALDDMEFPLVMHGAGRAVAANGGMHFA